MNKLLFVLGGLVDQGFHQVLHLLTELGVELEFVGVVVTILKLISLVLTADLLVYHLFYVVAGQVIASQVD